MIEKLNCDKCVATQQMCASEHCTKTIVKHDSSFIPECFVRIKNISQEERNYLMCPTYNLGMYSVCQTCPLSCVKNPNKKEKSPMSDIINLFGTMFGVDDKKKKDIDEAFEKLNQPDFQDIYSSIGRVSNSIKNIMNGNVGSADIAKKILEAEATNLKEGFNNLIKSGKITEEEAKILNTEINSEKNIQKLKSVLENIKTKV